jgi:hypothetical protein
LSLEKYITIIEIVSNASSLSTVLELYSEIALSRNELGMEHNYLHKFLLGLNNIKTSHNTDLFFLDTVYARSVIQTQYNNSLSSIALATTAV